MVLITKIVLGLAVLASLAISFFFVFISFTDIDITLKLLDAYNELEIPHLVIYPSVLISVLICIRDINYRFTDKNEKAKWYWLLFMFGVVTFPYYYFRYILFGENAENFSGEKDEY